MSDTDEKLDKLIEYLESGKGKNNPIYTAVAASVIASVILWGLTQIVNAPSNINTKIDAVNSKVETTNKRIDVVESGIKEFKTEYDYNTANIQYNFSVLNVNRVKLVPVYKDDSNLRSANKQNNN